MCVCVCVTCWLYYVIRVVKMHYKVNMDFEEVGCECGEWIYLIQDIVLSQALVMKFRLP
jgi:hypothetical protein